MNDQLERLAPFLAADVRLDSHPVEATYSSSTQPLPIHPCPPSPTSSVAGPPPWPRARRRAAASRCDAPLPAQAVTRNHG
eukprot:437586-Pleurochrysis_carterae.AAC.1